MTPLKTLLAAAMIASPLAAALLPPQAQAQDNRTNVYSDAFRSRDAIADTLDAIGDFGAARAAGDADAAELAAADMLVGLLRTRFWLAMLDDEVTATSHTAEIDAQVTELRVIAIQGFDAVLDALADNDLDALEATLDASGDWLNALQINGRQVMQALFPS